jgi:hypothetical protein
MRKIAMTGLTLVLVMFLMTCDQDSLPDELEYTDVVYDVSPESETIAITVYLDGEKVPVTKEQRAMSRDLAKMAYDYFEVIFIGPENDVPPYDTLPAVPIARSSWELGQGAGISGVYRGPAGAGHDYNWIPNNPDFERSTAIMFVGRKDGKTLLGVGRIGDVDHEVANRTDPVDPSTTIYEPDGFPTDPVTIITDESKSVTFYITAVKTGLLIGLEVPDLDDNPLTENAYNIKADSFEFVDTAGDPDYDSTIPGWTRSGHSSRSPLGSYNYPMYSLPVQKDTPGRTNPYPYQNAEYSFRGAVEQYWQEIKLNQSVASGAIVVEKRFPRYVQGGRYYQPKENVDTDTTLKFDADKYGDLNAGDSINSVVPLRFQTLGMGIFSFYIEIPVYMVTKDESTNGVLEAEVWKIRTGFGSELYSLDTGKSSAGCTLIGVGVTSLDWLEIEWEWVRNPSLP